MISFEAGVEALRRFIGRGGDEAYFANETDPLHAAFRAKRPCMRDRSGFRCSSEPPARNLSRSLPKPARRRPWPTCTCRFAARAASTACSTKIPSTSRFAPIRGTPREGVRPLASRPVQSREAGGEISALYFGGGTPSVLAPRDIERS